MPISVLCPGCKTRFEVSEKFAGKQGPCPKCKQTIKIPEVVAEEVKVHVPDVFSSAGKDRTGRSISKPIPRRETKIRPGVIGAIVVGSTLALAVAVIGRGLSEAIQYGIVVVGLLLVGPPISVGGYFFLRNDELEPHQGQALWVRAFLCGLGFAVLWGVFWYLRFQTGMPNETFHWFFVAPLFIGAGGGIAFAAFDLEFGSGALLYCFYLVVTIILRWAIGFPAIWAAAAATSTGS
jgi:hypothetical protein